MNWKSVLYVYTLFQSLLLITGSALQPTCVLNGACLTDIIVIRPL